MRRRECTGDVLKGGKCATIIDVVAAMTVRLINLVDGGMETSKEDYVDCIDGHQMCHEGRLQCPRCCDANRLKNKPQWRCGNCNEIIGTHQQVVDHWDTCKRANILRDYGD